MSRENKKSISTIIAIISVVIMVLSGVLMSWSSYRAIPDETAEAPVDTDTVDIAQIQDGLKRKPLAISLTEGARGFYLSADELIQKETADEETIAARIDAVFSSIKQYDFNTVIVDTKYQSNVIYASEVYYSYPVDVLRLVKEKANQQEISLFAVYHMSDVDYLLSETDFVSGIEEFVQNYVPDGILLDGYSTNADAEQYMQYMTAGGGSGFDDWMCSRNTARIDQVVSAVREVVDSIPVGLITDPVWALKSKNSQGINGKASYQTYYDGHADTKSWIDNQNVDFVCVVVKESLTDSSLDFGTISGWWVNVANQAKMPLYFILAGENVCTSKAGWSGTDQLIRQVSLTSKLTGYYGSFFSGYDRMAADPQGSTSALLKYYADEYTESNLFQDLTISSPKKLSLTTYDGTIVFSGKYDPQFEVTINDKKVIPTKKGEFYEKYNLEIGTNKYTIRHKGQVKTYTIVRKVKVFESVSPTGTLEVDGETNIRVEAKVYRGSQVTAIFNGKTITLSELENADGDSKDSTYTSYVGTFTAPKSGSADKQLGAIQFKATYKNSTESKTGASVTLLKKIEIPDWSPGGGDGLGGAVIAPINPQLQVRVDTDYLEVYDPGDTDPYPSAKYYSPPKGTIDYVDSQRVISGKTFYYLHSGKRVLKSDVTTFTGTYNGNNALSEMQLSEEGNGTILRLKQKWNAPFNITFNDVEYYTGSADHDFYVRNFTSDTVTITFDYATQAEAVSKELLKNTTMFTDIKLEKIIQYNIDRYRLHLKLARPGKYYGCYSYYDEDGYLVLRFNNIKGSLDGVRIFLDPGHGGSDPGAIGKYVENNETYIVKEAEVNLAIVKKLAEKLRARGAVVEYLTEEERAKYMASAGGLPDRYKVGQRFQADILLSVHCNSSGSTASGTEAWYTTPFSMPLAREISAGIAASTGINNRGPHNNRFAVNRGRTFPSVLIETAFVSNDKEVRLLNSEEGQDNIATGIVNGIINYLK